MYAGAVFLPDRTSAVRGDHGYPGAVLRGWALELLFFRPGVHIRFGKISAAAGAAQYPDHQ